MDVRVIVVAALVLAGPVQAQQVFKCIDGKDVSYQTDPCPKGVPVKAWDAKPEPVRAYRAPVTQETAYAPQQSYQQPQQSSQLHRVAIARDDDACQAAKRHRDSVLNTVGLRRTFELLRQLDARVYSACK